MVPNTENIIGIIYFLFSGTFLTFSGFYLVAFYKKRKSVKQLILRFILLFFFFGIIVSFLDIGFDLLERLSKEENNIWFGISSILGICGGIILFRIGYKRGLKHRT